LLLKKIDWFAGEDRGPLDRQNGEARAACASILCNLCAPMVPTFLSIKKLKWKRVTHLGKPTMMKRINEPSSSGNQSTSIPSEARCIVP